MVEPQLAVPPPSPQDLTLLFELENQRGGGEVRGGFGGNISICWLTKWRLGSEKKKKEKGGKMPTRLGIIILDNIGTRLILDTLKVRHILVTLGI